jgi:hypothetical protein
VKGELKKHGLSTPRSSSTRSRSSPSARRSWARSTCSSSCTRSTRSSRCVRAWALPGWRGQEHYDLNLQPTAARARAARAWARSGMYALLAHGAKANIREMQTWKSKGPIRRRTKRSAGRRSTTRCGPRSRPARPCRRRSPDLRLPQVHRPTWGAGINIEKKGHDFVLTPAHRQAHPRRCREERLCRSPPSSSAREAQTRSGEPEAQAGRSLRREAHGRARRKEVDAHRSRRADPEPHLRSADPRAHGPLEEGLRRSFTGEVGHAGGTLTELGAGVTGGAGIKTLLDKIDVQEGAPAEEELNAAPAPRSTILKKVKYLQALDQLGMKPSRRTSCTTCLCCRRRCGRLLLPTVISSTPTSTGSTRTSRRSTTSSRPDPQKHLTDSGSGAPQGLLRRRASAIMGVGSRTPMPSTRASSIRSRGAQPEGRLLPEHADEPSAGPDDALDDRPGAGARPR